MSYEPRKWLIIDDETYVLRYTKCIAAVDDPHTHFDNFEMVRQHNELVNRYNYLIHVINTNVAAMLALADQAGYPKEASKG
jgi:hypothetical protein